MSADTAAGHLRHWGEGPRRALLVHCTLAHSGEWAGVAPRLGDLLSMEAGDLPSHGRAEDWTPQKGDLHDMATAALAARLGSGPVDLIGHSFGATVCLRAALDHPGGVRSLVLIEPVLFAAVTGGGPHASNRAFAESWARGAREETARRFIDLWGGPGGWDALPDRQQAYILDRIHLVPAQDPSLAWDRPGVLAPGRLEALDIPVLFLAGSESPPVAREIVERLAAHLPRARVQIVAGAGHMLPLTHAREVAAAIRAFLAGG